MRKSMVAFAAGVCVLLSACSGGGTSTTPSASPDDKMSTPASQASSAPAMEGGSLVIWADDTRTPMFKKFGEELASKHGFKLDVVQKPVDDIANDLVAQAATGQGPDLVITAHDGVGKLVKNGVISPVDFASKAADFNPAAVSAMTLDGKVWGVPYAMENIGLVRNNKLAQDTPATFDELIAQGKTIQGSEYPVLIQQGAQGDAYHLYPLQTSFGAPVFKMANGEYTNELGMAGPEGQAFAAYLKKLAAEGVLSADIGADQAKQLFLDGKSAYMITGPWNTTAFKEAGMDISVLPVPAAGPQPSAPFLGVQGIFVSAHSKNALLANSFLDLIASKEAQDLLYKMGGRAPALTASASAIDDPLIKGFDEAGKSGQPMPAIAEMGYVWEFWGNTEMQILNGTAADPAAAWTAMVENIKAKF